MEFFGIGIAGWAERFALGLLIGFCIGMTGVGGGVLVLPALTLLLGMSPVVAVGTASSYSFLTKVSATIHHLRLKTIDWSVSTLFFGGGPCPRTRESRFGSPAMTSHRRSFMG